MRNPVFAIAWSMLLVGSGNAFVAVANAQPAAPEVVTVDHARDAFISAGYTIDEPLLWSWTSPPVTAFHVQDPNSDRLAVVLVYPSRADADIARGRSQPLVLGYAAETWTANVAVTQTTRSALDRLQDVQNACNDGVMLGDSSSMLQTPKVTEAGVDSGFIRALDLSAGNL